MRDYPHERFFGAEKQLCVITGKMGDEIGRWESEKQPAEIKKKE